MPSQPSVLSEFRDLTPVSFADQLVKSHYRKTLVLYRDRSGMTERRMRKETDRIGFDTAV